MWIVWTSPANWSYFFDSASKCEMDACTSRQWSKSRVRITCTVHTSSEESETKKSWTTGSFFRDSTLLSESYFCELNQQLTGQSSKQEKMTMIFHWQQFYNMEIQCSSCTSMPLLLRRQVLRSIKKAWNEPCNHGNCCQSKLSSECAVFASSWGFFVTFRTRTASKTHTHTHTHTYTHTHTHTHTHTQLNTAESLHTSNMHVEPVLSQVEIESQITNTIEFKEMSVSSFFARFIRRFLSACAFAAERNKNAMHRCLVCVLDSPGSCLNIFLQKMNK